MSFDILLFRATMRILLIVLAGSVVVLLFAVWAAIRAVRRHGSERRETIELRLGRQDQPAAEPEDL